MRSNLLRNIVLYFCASACLLAAGWYGHDLYRILAYGEKKVRRIKAAGYRLTSPLLDIELPEGLNINQEPINFRYKVDNFVKQVVDGTRVQKVSVYYRDMGDGPWFSINENQEFNPASMMKVAIMIAWLKRTEANADTLKQTFLFDGAGVDMTSGQTTKPRHTLEAGHRYTVETLLEYMMSYSDNNATSLLLNNVPSAELMAVVKGMGITQNPNGERNSITAHNYSGFFRILYNASFLNRDLSERALQLLSKEDFPQGIYAGVPKGVTVASKFGEFVDENSNQLHEFGIVYHPKGAYVIGIMTKGNDFAFQTSVIRDISALIYREVDAGAILH